MAECFDKVVLVVYIWKGAYVMHEVERFSAYDEIYTQRHARARENELTARVSCMRKACTRYETRLL
jgi:hypothetical protein